MSEATSVPPLLLSLPADSSPPIYFVSVGF